MKKTGQPAKSETPSERKARALAAVADCSPRTREIVAMMPFSDPTDRDREIAEKIMPIAQRAMARKKHGKRVA